MGNRATVGWRIFVVVVAGLRIAEGAVIGFFGCLAVLMEQGIVPSRGVTWSAAAIAAILAVATAVGGAIGFLCGWRVTRRIHAGVRIFEQLGDDRWSIR
jgi:ABC-type xylose transport system permease subunit